MTKLTRLIKGKLSVKISLMAVSAMAVLLMASMAVMLHYSRGNIKSETLQKVMLTLDATVQNIDNILLSVEQSAGNVYFSMLPYLNDPKTVEVYRRKLVESNPYIDDCTITFGDSSYTGQRWIVKPKESLISFCLPMMDHEGNSVGLMNVDVSLSLLSHIVAQAKPSENSSCVLIDSLGRFIVHPDGDHLIQQSAFTFSEYGDDTSTAEAVRAMLSGETDYKPFRMFGRHFYVFFKPFNRATIHGRVPGVLGWSAGIIYPEDDIFGDYNSLLYYVLAIAVVGLLLMYLLTYTVVKSRLKPLLMLSDKAQHIAAGHYNEPIPDSRQIDEIGRLQDNFQIMQQSLATQIGELETLKNTLYDRCEGLHQAYNQAKKADRMKTAFLHNMTNQMLDPAESIDKDVSMLCGQSPQDSSHLVSDIRQKGKVITELLKNLITMSDEEMRKEADND